MNIGADIEEDNQGFSLRYWVAGLVIGGLVFVGFWIYALFAWGVLLGLAFGWLPALIAGVIARWAWPLIAGLVILACLWVGFMFIMNNFDTTPYIPPTSPTTNQPLPSWRDVNLCDHGEEENCVEASQVDWYAP